ncbi:MAG: hypothetical protein QXJ33_04780 [Acidilobaceae archaeon]
MGFYHEYLKLSGDYGIDDDTATRVYDLIQSLTGNWRLYCTGLSSIQAPSLPPAEDGKVLPKIMTYVRRFKSYSRILSICSKFLEDLSSLGESASDAFYIYHLTDIASTRLSGVLTLKLESIPDSLVRGLILDLKNIEVNIYNTLNSIKWVVGPLKASLEQSRVYNALWSELLKQNINLESIQRKVDETTHPILTEKLIAWVEASKDTIYATLRSSSRKKARWKNIKSKRDPKHIALRVIKRVDKILGPYRVGRLGLVLLGKMEDKVLTSFVVCEIAREVADYTNIHSYLLISSKPINYIELLWRPPKCPSKNFKWPLESILEAYASRRISYSEATEILDKSLRSMLKLDILVPEDIIDKYIKAILEVVRHILAWFEHKNLRYGFIT